MFSKRVIDYVLGMQIWEMFLWGTGLGVQEIPRTIWAIDMAHGCLLELEGRGYDKDTMYFRHRVEKLRWNCPEILHSQDFLSVSEDGVKQSGDLGSFSW